ncbi:MAG: FAD-binding oxidoreductase [Balneolaceae bacterium]|nr:FAD-binding oxidoreductase [Balneolaceae bacterium]
MKTSGWGRYPVIDSEVVRYNSDDSLFENIDGRNPVIPYGFGRSYGDSALSDTILKMRPAKRMLHFDPENGLLTCEAGVLLSEILETFLPRGWFLKVTPGTKYITIGGAIASDVHGKNHHQYGAFSEYVSEFSLMMPNGSIKACSRTKNKDLFYATCGGMGLTGIILKATISLQSVQSNTIVQQTIKTACLKEIFQAFEEYYNEPYSVAWIDCTATGSSLGRGLLNVGHFKEDHKFEYKAPGKLNMPLKLPGFLLNKWSIKLFNQLYYQKNLKSENRSETTVDSFFYPLDILKNWNRLYGEEGPLQYQFVLPKKTSFDGIKEVLNYLQKKNMYSSLGVLKLFGKENKNLLSFPMEGYTLALDFKVDDKIFQILDDLDKIISGLGGRIYLAKDARMSVEIFNTGYSKAKEFRSIRDQYGMNKIFNSLQSNRLNL